MDLRLDAPSPSFDLKFIVFNMQRGIKKKQITVIETDDGRFTDPGSILTACAKYFKDFFSKGEATGVLTPDLWPDNMVLDSENDQLMRPIEDAEIYHAVMGANKDGSPRPHGFPNSFFQKYWHVVSGDLSNAVKHFFPNGRMVKKLGQKHLVLLPKKGDSKHIPDYRPIALGHSLFGKTKSTKEEDDYDQKSMCNHKLIKSIISAHRDRVKVQKENGQEYHPAKFLIDAHCLHMCPFNLLSLLMKHDHRPRPVFPYILSNFQAVVHGIRRLLRLVDRIILQLLDRLVLKPTLIAEVVLVARLSLPSPGFLRFPGRPHGGPADGGCLLLHLGDESATHDPVTTVAALRLLLTFRNAFTIAEWVSGTGFSRPCLVMVVIKGVAGDGRENGLRRPSCGLRRGPYVIVGVRIKRVARAICRIGITLPSS
ncbi:Transposon TX1 uncharacterized protein [Nymphaea thermarum]|nr:Transposon TX1 uncharacterized protein [Nymphaea thermarum]